MNLVIDLGNSRDKIALFENRKQKALASYKKLNKSHIDKMCLGKKIGAVILSSVKCTDQDIVDHLRSSFRLYFMNEKIKLPVKIAYRTPGTLGNDRLACAVAAAALFPGKNILTIDAGTCIKYDLVTSAGVYLGGAIAPGLEMRLKAMHTFTARLPLVKLSHPPGLVGDTTKDSLLSGAVNGAAHEVKETIHRYRAKYKGLKVILTGGDMDYFEKPLKSRIFAVPGLVLQGLNLILEHNVKNE